MRETGPENHTDEHLTAYNATPQHTKQPPALSNPAKRREIRTQSHTPLHNRSKTTRKHNSRSKMACANVRSTLECQEDSGGVDCRAQPDPRRALLKRCRFSVHRALEAHAPVVANLGYSSDCLGTPRATRTMPPRRERHKSAANA
jgi:hypothetical protein